MRLVSWFSGRVFEHVGGRRRVEADHHGDDRAGELQAEHIVARDQADAPLPTTVSVAMM